MGLNTGLVIVGAIGDNLRIDYTVIGDATNVAARLQRSVAPGLSRSTAGSERSASTSSAPDIAASRSAPIGGHHVAMSLALFMRHSTSHRLRTLAGTPLSRVACYRFAHLSGSSQQGHLPGGLWRRPWGDLRWCADSPTRCAQNVCDGAPVPLRVGARGRVQTAVEESPVLVTVLATEPVYQGFSVYLRGVCASSLWTS